MAKVYAKGNYLFLEIPGNVDPLIDGKSKVLIFPVDESADDYTIKSELIGNRTFNLSELEDESGTPYNQATWDEFYLNNSGFNSASGGSGAESLDNRVVVKTASDFGVIDSTKQYFIDGVIDMSGIEIIVPVGGIHFQGYGFDLSCLKNTSDNETLFVSPVGGSGGVFLSGMTITMSGTGSKVYDLTDATGFNAIERDAVNYEDCTSLGELNGYRQGLEVNTGRFGGSPELCLSGTWLGGYRATTTITRNLSDSWSGTMFKAGAGFVMNSRFLTDMNVDLGSLCSFLDFSDSNFVNPSTLELRDVIMTRNGLTVPNDTNLTPNITASNLVCSWRDNNGVPNTFVGGISTCTTEVETVLSVGLPFILLGTFTNTDMQHFDSPSNGQLRHLGTNPREYTVNFDFVIEGGSNQEYRIDLIKNDGTPNIVYSQTRVINNLQGGRDVGYYTGLANVILNQNDFVYWQVTNLTNNSNCTLELDSSWSVEER